jgi:exocyst complex protein 7
MQALADDTRDKTSGSGWKAAAKEKFTRFYDLLEEVGERHRMAKVLEEDAEERSAVGEEVVKLVVPSLQRFMQKQKEKEFSKSELLVLVVCHELTQHQILKSVSHPYFCANLLPLTTRPVDIKLSPEEVESRIRNFYN